MQQSTGQTRTDGCASETLRWVLESRYDRSSFSFTERLLMSSIREAFRLVFLEREPGASFSRARRLDLFAKILRADVQKGEIANRTGFFRSILSTDRNATELIS
jgi:hypothetical protein